MYTWLFTLDHTHSVMYTQLCTFGYVHLVMYTRLCTFGYAHNNNRYNEYAMMIEDRFLAG